MTPELRGRCLRRRCRLQSHRNLGLNRRERVAESEIKSGWKLLILGRQRKMNEEPFNVAERRKTGSSWVNILLGIWVITRRLYSG